MLNSKTPIEYDKESKMDEYCDFVINNAPKDKPFTVKNLLLENLKNENRNIIMDLFNDVQIRLIQMDKLEFIKSAGKCKLLTDLNNITNNFNNDFSNSNIGQVNQSSSFSSSPTNINTTATEPKKPLTEKLWKIITENKLISGIILLIITEEITIGKIWKFIISLF